MPTLIDSSGSRSMQKRHSKNNPVVQRYGDGESFAKIFNPDLQVVCAKNIERSFCGDAPTVSQLLRAFPEKQVRVWIMAQLENLNSFTGAKDKMNPAQMLMLSDIIMTEYFYLKASELLLFFHQFKSGNYGELYGSVDPLRVSSALVEFSAYRRDMLFRIEQGRAMEQKKEERKKREETAITWEEYQQKNGDRK